MTDTFDEYQDALVDPPQTGGCADILLTIAGTLALVFFIRLFVAETFEVPSGSMLETIQLGDRLVGEKVTLHWSDPEPGDIITFDDPDGSGVTLIKRVIATEGQVVDLQDGYVYVDGVAIDEPYVEGKPTYPLDGHSSNLEENVTFPYTVPAGCFWVMGDNRTNSLDSRYFGVVPRTSVTSKALFIFWPPEDACFL
jgi:signal peptidase I